MPEVAALKDAVPYVSTPFWETDTEAVAGAVAFGEGATLGAAAVALCVPLVQPYKARQMLAQETWPQPMLNSCSTHGNLHEFVELHNWLFVRGIKSYGCEGNVLATGSNTM